MRTPGNWGWAMFNEYIYILSVDGPKNAGPGCPAEPPRGDMLAYLDAHRDLNFAVAARALGINATDDQLRGAAGSTALIERQCDLLRRQGKNPIGIAVGG